MTYKEKRILERVAEEFFQEQAIEEFIQKLEEAKSIRGTNLYALWSDLCGKDMAKVETLCKNCPTDILEDACNRQDYSGRELVSEYVS